MRVNLSDYNCQDLQLFNALLQQFEAAGIGVVIGSVL